MTEEIIYMTGTRTAAENMALDETIVQTLEDENKAYLRVYEWKPYAISIGYFQSLQEEVDVKECKKNGVDIVRRLTGGGAVYHQHEITYSYISKHTKEIPQNIIKSYEKILNPIIKSLQYLEIDAKFTPLNDLTCKNKKISGNAQTRRNGLVLQHGTILLDVNVEEMFSMLKVPNEKLRGKIITNIKERVIGIEKILRKKIDKEKFSKSVLNNFSIEFNAKLTPYTPSTQQEAIFQELVQKYSSNKWTNLK